MKTFITTLNDIKTRLDTDYYQPIYTELEEKVTKDNSAIISDYIEDLSGGATPSSQKKDVYYTDNPNEGIPFIRVQNLSQAGLKVDDVKYITPLVHNGMLQRSQSNGGDLLVKITGVGRMAVSSVVPENYECNINQHIVRIKTKDRKTSEVLATYLNTDIGEKLARRRSTGGTRPALDYEALKSIPIVFDTKIVDIMQSAYKKKQELEQKAEELLEGIQNLIFTSLGIEESEREDSLTKVISSVEVQNNRFDPFYYIHPQDTKPSTMYEEKTLGEIAELEKGKSISKKNINSGDYPVIAGGQSSPYSIDRCNYEGNVITVSASGAYSGYVWYHDYPIFASDCTVIKSKNEEEISTHYIYCVLRAKQRFIYNMQQGAGQPHVYASDLERINIPVPSKEKQKEVSKEVQKRIEENKTLRKTAKEVIEQAKAQVEEIILRN